MGKGVSYYEKALWWVYGHTYDGLLKFWPYQNLLRLMLERASIKPGLNVLDLGCGTGNLLAEAFRYDISATGVDISSSMLKRAEKKLGDEIKAGNLKLIKSDVVEFLKTQPDSSYDRILMTNVVYALHNRDQLWEESKRVLKPGGLIVCSTADSTDSHQIVREHLEHRPWYTLLRPRLIGVGVIDGLINAFGYAQKLPFPDEALILEEVKKAGGTVSSLERCYGGADIIFIVRFR